MEASSVVVVGMETDVSGSVDNSAILQQVPQHQLSDLRKINEHGAEYQAVTTKTEPEPGGGLSPLFFPVKNEKTEEKINQYRQQYRNIRESNSTVVPLEGNEQGVGALAEQTIELDPSLKLASETTRNAASTNSVAPIKTEKGVKPAIKKEEASNHLMTVDNFSLTVTPPFILKLCSMLATKSFVDLVCWGDRDDTVLVKDLSQFSSTVLPKYFKHKNFTSFLRQLNMYGFYTLRQGENWREFKNELFKKNSSENFVKIKRKTTQLASSSSISIANKPAKVSRSKSMTAQVTGETHSERDKSKNVAGTKQKESRKRKKDEFKGKGSKNSSKTSSKDGMDPKTVDLIKQLQKRCEKSEQKIKSLEKEIASLKKFMSKIANVTETSSNPASRTNSKSTSSTLRRRNTGSTETQPNQQDNRNINESLNFGPDFLPEGMRGDINMGSSFDGFGAGPSGGINPHRGRSRTLSDTFLSICTISNGHTPGNHRNLVQMNAQTNRPGPQLPHSSSFGSLGSLALSASGFNREVFSGKGSNNNPPLHYNTRSSSLSAMEEDLSLQLCNLNSASDLQSGYFNYPPFVHEFENQPTSFHHFRSSKFPTPTATNQDQGNFRRVRNPGRREKTTKSRQRRKPKKKSSFSGENAAKSSATNSAQMKSSDGRGKFITSSSASKPEAGKSSDSSKVPKRKKKVPRADRSLK